MKKNVLLKGTCAVCAALVCVLSACSDPAPALGGGEVKSSGVACEWFDQTTTATGYFTYSVDGGDETDGTTGDDEKPSVTVEKCGGGKVSVTTPQFKYGSYVVKPFAVSDAVVSAAGGVYYASRQSFTCTAEGKSDSEKWNVEGQSLSVEVNSGVLTLKVVFRLEGMDETFTVNFTSGSKSSEGSEDGDGQAIGPVLTVADYAVGTYTGDYKGTVKVVLVTGTGTGTYSHVITKTGDTQVSLTMPEITAMGYTMKSFTITDIEVSTEDSRTYTLTSTKSTFSPDDTTDSKVMTVSSFAGSITDGVLTLNVVYKYGSMPANMTYVFPQ